MTVSTHVSAPSVFAVIVTFNPEPVYLDRLLAAVVPQVSAVVIVDNGSISPVCSPAGHHPVTLLPLGENYGIAAGFNRGIVWAREQGAEQILLLDQDSMPRPDMVAELQRALARLAAAGERVAAVGPALHDERSGLVAGFARFGPLRFGYHLGTDENGTVVSDFLISSGSLIQIAALDEIGLMDEGLFIDLVDTEWFLRGRAAGWRAFGVPRAFMCHGIGDGSVSLRFAGKVIGSLHTHSPLRHYYIFRNSVILSLRPYVPWNWRWNNVVQLLGMFIWFSLRTPPRREHLQMMLRGVWHGIIGITGRYS